MPKIRRLVLDILKPHKPSIIEITSKLSEADGVEGANASLIEVDEEVKNVKVTIEGKFEEDDVRGIIENASASIHSVDEVAVGEKLVNKVSTPQD